MINTKFLVTIALITMYMPLFAFEPESNSGELLVSAADFTAVAGDSWKGTLTYLDYSKNSESSIPVEMRFDEPGARKVVYRIKYPGETQYNATEKLKWSRDGRRLNGETIISRNQEPDGTTVLVTQADGKDDSRPAEIRTTYSLNPTALSISKEVRLEGTADFFRRNAYELTR